MTQPFSTKFPCEDGTGELRLEQNHSSYDLRVQITNSTTGEIYGGSTTDRLFLTQPRRYSNHTIHTDAGVLRIGWDVWDGAQRHGWCPSSGLIPIDITLQGATGAPFAYSFSCYIPPVETPLLPSGTYQVQVSGVWGTRSASASLEVVIPTGGNTVTAPFVKLVF
jgi:hypothetical protein